MRQFGKGPLDPEFRGFDRILSSFHKVNSFLLSGFHQNDQIVSKKLKKFDFSEIFRFSRPILGVNQRFSNFLKVDLHLTAASRSRKNITILDTGIHVFMQKTMN